MKKILLYAPFPTPDKERDGYIQRVKSIDFLLRGYMRVYISVRGDKNLFYLNISSMLKENVVVIEAGHFFAVLYSLYYLFFVKNIYIHNLRRFSILYKILKYMPIFSPKIILDLHGVVPEEMKFLDANVDIDKINDMERFCFSRLSACVHVTEAMQDFYKKKYPQYYNEIEHIMLGIKPHGLEDTSQIVDEEVESLLKYYHISKESIVIVYSGGLQKWQKIDDMLKLVSKCENKNIIFIFLTRDVEGLKGMILQKKLNQTIYVNSVPPDKLSSYYKLAHYGFALRDDNPVNSVANPTKIIEYLYFGLTPIVDYVDIGDFRERGYHFIKKSDLNYDKLTNQKNKNNIDVAKRIIKTYDEQVFLKLVNKIFS